MIIALDYDDTFTRDPKRWYEAMMIMRQAGYTVYGVTMRYPHEASGMEPEYVAVCNRIFFTGRKAKRDYMWEQDIYVHVWIDDAPHWILQDALH